MIVSETQGELANIRRDCAVVLSGAEYVREKLLSLASIGPNPLARSSSIYAIKCRVKSEDRLVNKVVHRQTIRKDPSYSAYRVRDIVGLRLICIYSENLLTVTRAFLDFVRFCQTDHICLFEGMTLDAAIEEIKVYSSTQASYVYDAVYAELSNFGISHSKIEAVPATRSEPYSSIHIVCRALSFHAAEPKAVPVEVQIRTVFEDAWSEIDHPLRYKGFDYRRVVSDEEVNEEVERLYSNAKQSVLALKGILDSLAIQAEAVRGGFLGLDRTFRKPSQSSGPVAIPGIHFRLRPSSIFSAEPDFKIRTEAERIDRMIDRFYNSLAHAVVSKLPDLLLSSTEIIKNLAELWKEYEENRSADELDAEFKYWVHLEKALVLVWRSHISRMIGGQAAISSYGDIETAIVIYKEFYHRSEYVHDSLIPFRLANAIVATQITIDLPIDLMEQAEARLDSDAKRAGTMLSVSIARQRAMFRWIKVQKIRRDKAAFGVLAERVGVEVDTIREALLASDQADERLKKLANAGAVSEETLNRELIRSANNFLSYLWEYCVLLGKMDDFALKIVNSGRIPSLIATLKEGTENWTNNVGRLDSLVRGYHLLADPETKTLAIELKKCAQEASFLSQVQRDGVNFTISKAANLYLLRGDGDENS
ncbi:hypothetical protein [Bradyrhizobium oligotrophicum]|uniref:hypothetical protein n=1 Tax=Bradyrhizobium oligotrophicum TaxID=44255 RepID=UPI003EBDE6A2